MSTPQASTWTMIPKIILMVVISNTVTIKTNTTMWVTKARRASVTFANLNMWCKERDPQLLGVMNEDKLSPIPTKLATKILDIPLFSPAWIRFKLAVINSTENNGAHRTQLKFRRGGSATEKKNTSATDLRI